MVLSQNIIAAMESNPVSGIAPRTGYLPCALQPFGCTGNFAPERVTVVLPDSTKLGLCANFRRHTQMVNEAPDGAEVKRFFNWMIDKFQSANPDRVRGASLADAPIHIAVLSDTTATPAPRRRGRPARAAVTA